MEPLKSWHHAILLRRGIYAFNAIFKIKFEEIKMPKILRLNNLEKKKNMSKVKIMTTFNVRMIIFYHWWNMIWERNEYNFIVI